MSNFNFQKFLLNKAQKSIMEGLELYGKNNDNIDKIIVWIVGFSTTIVTVLIANFSKDNIIIEKSGGWIISLASLTIVFGVLQRIVMAHFNKLQIDIIFSFDYFVTGYNFPEDNKYFRHLLENENTLKEVLDYLYLDFGYRFTEITPEEGSKEYHELRKSLIQKYEELQNNLLIFETNFFNDTLSRQLGYEFPKITNTEENKTRKPQIRNLLKISNWLFYLMCISFISVILVAVLTYLIN